MKYWRIVAAFLFFLSTTFLYAEEHHERFLMEKSEEAYSAGNYDSSAIYLQQLTSQGFRSFELFYNLGNAQYKLGNIPEAILYYEKAKKIRPNEDDLNYNLELANSKITDNIQELPGTKVVTLIAGALATDTWAFLSVLAFFLFLAGLFLFFYLPSTAQKNISLSTTIITLVLSVFLFFLAQQRKSNLDQKQEAVIMSPSVTAISAPSENGKRLFVIHEGLKVEILEEQGNFAKIRLADGNVGWVNVENFRVI